ncbi:MAG TPA: hypothetical protein DCR93_21690 [Cytophagales bacterium]|nr:hypothetical protein [Cytophagales bacterium]
MSSWTKPSSFLDADTALLVNVVEHLDVPCTRNTLAERLRDHPYFPQNLMSSYSEVLTDLRIPNLAVDLDTEDLDEIESFPVMAQLDPDLMGNTHAQLTPPLFGVPLRSIMVMVTEVTASTVTFLDVEKGWYTLDRKDFLQLWKGITMLVAKESWSGDPKHTENAQRQRLTRWAKASAWGLGSGLLLLAILLGLVGDTPFWKWLPLLVLKSAGLTLGVLLLLERADKTNAVVAAVCGTKTPAQGPGGCGNGLLEGPAASLWGWLSWAEVGAGYFAGGLLTLVLALFANATAPVLLILAVLNVLALPYTVWSLTYQARHKQWCRLCVGVQILLWLELAALLPLWINPLPVLTLNSMVWVLLGFGLPLLVWLTLGKGLAAGSELRALRQEMAELKRNPAILDFHMRHTKPVAIAPVPGIVLGNPEAPNVLTVFSSPFCPPCGQMHHMLEDLILANGEAIRVNIRFADRKTEERNRVAQYLLALARQGAAPEDQLAAMRSWFSRENRDVAAISDWIGELPPRQTPAVEYLTGAAEDLKAQADWAQNQGLKATPSLFLNGVKLSHWEGQLYNLRYYLQYLEVAAPAMETTQAESS